MCIERIITDKLNEIEEKEDIKILHAVESGSRAWGFASPDSDYDVRFVYVRKKNDYLRLGKIRDVIEWELNDVYDINGWDISKTLRLLYKSNPTVFEWFHSPIVYHTHSKFINELIPEIDGFFSCKSGIYHYVSTARSNSNYLKDEKVKLKKYFYIIRPLLACKWILENSTPPPVLFRELLNSVAENNIKPVIEELIRLKTDSPETIYGEHIPELDMYIKKNITEIKRYADSMDDDRKHNQKTLDDMFLRCIDFHG